MMHNIHSKKMKVGELDVHYLTGGDGDPLIVIHGGSEGARAWTKTMVELSKNNTIYVPDLPGFGHSQAMDSGYYIPELVEFVDEFSHKLGLKSFHLMGHSLGGGIALTYALKFPSKVKKLILVNSMFLGKEIALWVRLLSTPALIRLTGAAALAVLRCAKWVADLLFEPFEFVHPVSEASIALGGRVTTLKAQTTVLVNRLSEIMGPTLVVWGAKDPILPVSQAYDAAQLIPDCQVKVFEDGGHSVYRQKITEFSQLLARFLG